MGLIDKDLEYLVLETDEENPIILLEIKNDSDEPVMIYGNYRLRCKDKEASNDCSI